MQIAMQQEISCSKNTVNSWVCVLMYWHWTVSTEPLVSSNG